MTPNDPTPASPNEMACEDVRDSLHCLIENELESQEAESVLLHLSRCEECREALSQHVKLGGILRANLPWLGGLYFAKFYSARH